MLIDEPKVESPPKKMKFYSLRDLTEDKLPALTNLSADEKFALKTVSHVLPFRVNNYVVDELIDWNNIPNDPIYQLTFMQREMLEPHQFDKMADLIRKNAPKDEIAKMALSIRSELNPNPAGQLSANVPIFEGTEVPGIQHKYRETCLVFPKPGQTCFAYCTFCFRWPQFVETNQTKFATDESMRFQDYLKSKKEVTDVLFTGGDPMIMNVKLMKKYLEPLLEKEFDHIQSIRIGTKVLGYWPYRFTTDKDADEYLRLFERIVKSGKHLAFMAHFSHPVELSTPAVKEAIKRLRATGLEIRTQSPVLRKINDDARTWGTMWKEQVRLGLIPYYMFVERDTGPKGYFEIPLVRALQIYREALQGVSGLARTARGPSMSALPGKVSVEGVATINGEKVFVLNFLQGRNSDWIKRPFFAKYDPKATWLDELKPAFSDSFFYEEELKRKLGES